MRSLACVFVLMASLSTAHAADIAPLPGTDPLTMTGDITSALVDGVDRFLLHQIERSAEQRTAAWNREGDSIQAKRSRLGEILGLVDARQIVDALELVSTTTQPALVGESATLQILAVRWRAFGDVRAEGLLLIPKNREPLADVIAIGDADQTPESLVGLMEGLKPEMQFPRRLAESGCRVLVPLLVDRSLHKHRAATLTNREFIYRSAFELGRHVTGYELQMILTGLDFFRSDPAARNRRKGICGWGEGGRLALFAAALDPRIQAAGVSGYFGPREKVWQEPLDHNVFRLLTEFGDAELAAMIAPRTLVIEASAGPTAVVPPGTGGGPGQWTTPSLGAVRQEAERARPFAKAPQVIAPREEPDPFDAEPYWNTFLDALSPKAKLAAPSPNPKHLRTSFDPAARQQDLVDALSRHNQQVLANSANERKAFFTKLDTRSLEAFEKTVEPYREIFYKDVIGRFDEPLLPPAPRSRKSYDTPKYTGYEVVLDVFPDVIAYGILLVPKDLTPYERRPVVICQHGLEGRPQDCLAGGHKAYAGFATSLADEGFVVFAPQNLYIFGDRFRSLQRKANPLGKTLFSIIVPQHQQITDWLAGLPFVDPKRIAFYGLSYGGKTAMRVPPLVKNYCLSICSGDFNEWVWKNASVGNNYTYVGTGEYEIFEFNLGGTFNYAEMAALIAPRPFMVERGHFDGVAPDEAVAYEFAKVRNLYKAKLGIGDRVALEWFVGPHQIHGVGTFEFLRKHLKWGERP